MGLVEEEHHLWQFHIANLRHLVVDVGEQPHQECGVQLWLQHQLVGSQNVHHSPTPFSLYQVEDIERRFAEELLATLFCQCQQCALYCSY